MKNNELQNAWKNIDSKITPNSKEELDKLLLSKTKSTMNRYLYFIGASGIISAVFLIFLIVTMINRWDDIYYRSINLILVLYTVFSMVSTIKSFTVLNYNNTNAPLKDWLKQRIEMLSKWLASRIVFYILPLICMLIILSIHVYFEHKPLIDVIRTEESIFGLIFGLIIGITVAYLGLKQIRNQQRNSLEYLKEVYSNISDTE